MPIPQVNNSPRSRTKTGRWRKKRADVGTIRKYGNGTICHHLDDKDKITQPVKLLDDGYAISGCCGDGCYAISAITYCPFCGYKLMIKD